MSLETGTLHVIGVPDVIAAGDIHGNPGMRELPNQNPSPGVLS